jgi:hypothetical protein
MDHQSVLLRKKLSRLTSNIFVICSFIYIFTHNLGAVSYFLLYLLLPVMYLFIYFSLLKLQGLQCQITDFVYLISGKNTPTTITPKGLSLALATWLSLALLATYISIAQNHWQWGILLTLVPPILLSPILILLLYMFLFYI